MDNKGRTLEMQTGCRGGVFSACLKTGVSVARKGNLGEIGEIQGQDAEHGDLHVLAKEEAIGGSGCLRLSQHVSCVEGGHLSGIKGQARSLFPPSERQWGLSQGEGAVTNDQIWGAL